MPASLPMMYKHGVFWLRIEMFSARIEVFFRFVLGLAVGNVA